MSDLPSAGSPKPREQGAMQGVYHESMQEVIKAVDDAPNRGEMLSRDLALARNGDANAALRVSEILDTCIGPKIAGMASTVQRWRSKLDNPKVPQHVRDDLVVNIRKCSGVEKLANDPSVENSAYWLKEAARSGQPAAQSLSVVRCEDLGLEPSRCIDYLHNVLRAQRPESVELLFALSLKTSEQMYGVPADQEVAASGSELAQCEMGADCSPTSRWMNTFCTSGTCPPYASVRDALRQTTDPATYQAANDYAERLVTVVRSGSLDWPEIKQAEQIVRE